MPVAKKPSKTEPEGVVSGGVRNLPKKVTVETVREWTNSVYLAKNIKDFGVQIYPEPPTITVINDDKNEEVPELTKEIEQNFKDVRAWSAIQNVYPDIAFWGASLNSIGRAKVNGRWTITEIRHLPVESFTGYQTGTIINPLLPGITLDSDGKPLFFQTDYETYQTKLLSNVTSITDLATPKYAGKAICYPLYRLMATIELVDTALCQQVNRIGAPTIMPQIDPTYTPRPSDNDVKKWFAAFAKRWGKDSAFVIPPWATFPELRIRESTTAADLKAVLVKYINDYFNPLSVFQSETSTLGSSDSTRGQIYADYIRSLQEMSVEWLEREYNIILEMNGYVNHSCHIELKRPTVDKSSAILEQIKVGIAGKSLTKAEIRNNLTELELEDTTPELELALEKEYQNAGGFSFGNVADVENFTSPEERIMSDTEKRIIELNKKAMDGIYGIMNLPTE